MFSSSHEHSSNDDGASVRTTASLSLSASNLASAQREVPTPNQIVDQAVVRLEEFLPELKEGMRARIEAQIRWAVHSESEIGNTILRNSAAVESWRVLLSRQRLDRASGEVIDPPCGPSPTRGYVRSPEELADQALSRLVQAGTDLPLNQQQVVLKALRTAIASETDAVLFLVGHTPAEMMRDVLLPRVRPSSVVVGIDGLRLAACIHTPFWSEWFPGLENGSETGREIYQTLPGFPAEQVPAIVRRYENPASPHALPGAVSLLRHDVLHILLGRGLLDQDEAFVIGFTMGSAREELADTQVAEMKEVFSRRYPEPYRIVDEDLIAFELGVRAGRSIGIPHLWRMAIEEQMDEPLGLLRRRHALDIEALRDFYREEARLIPNTLESARLPL